MSDLSKYLKVSKSVDLCFKVNLRGSRIQAPGPSPGILGDDQWTQLKRCTNHNVLEESLISLAPIGQVTSSDPTWQLADWTLLCITLVSSIPDESVGPGTLRGRCQWGALEPVAAPRSIKGPRRDP